MKQVGMLSSAPLLATLLRTFYRIRNLQQTVMLFMKGNPEAPRCGFSQKTVNLLREEKVEFGWFDILEDEAVRQGGPAVQ